MNFNITYISNVIIKIQICTWKENFYFLFHLSHAYSDLEPRALFREYIDVMVCNDGSHRKKEVVGSMYIGSWMQTSRLFLVFIHGLELEFVISADF